MPNGYVQTGLECIEVGEVSLHTVDLATGQAICTECAGTQELTAAETFALMVDA
jgi:hypothetical protein